MDASDSVDGSSAVTVTVLPDTDADTDSGSLDVATIAPLPARVTLNVADGASSVRMTESGEIVGFGSAAFPIDQVIILSPTE